MAPSPPPAGSSARGDLASQWSHSQNGSSRGSLSFSLFLNTYYCVFVCELVSFELFIGYLFSCLHSQNGSSREYVFVFAVCFLLCMSLSFIHTIIYSVLIYSSGRTPRRGPCEEYIVLSSICVCCFSIMILFIMLLLFVFFVFDVKKPPYLSWHSQNGSLQGYVYVFIIVYMCLYVVVFRHSSLLCVMSYACICCSQSSHSHNGSLRG